MVLAAGLLVAPMWGHVDDTDAQLYQVIIRHLVRDHRWLKLSYLPTLHPQFREHLPFGFWPGALCVRLLHTERCLPLLGALWSLLTVGLVGWEARRIGGWWAAVSSMGLLAFNETFFRYGARARLDPLLILLSFTSAVPLLGGPVTKFKWIKAALGASLSVLVKGPFGLVLLSAAVLARGLQERKRSFWAKGIAALCAALIPISIFLLVDKLWWGGAWWNGYVREQLLASASGHRVDGTDGFFFPFLSIAGRFWPGLPLVGWAVWNAWRPSPRVAADLRVSLRLLSLSAIFSLLILCLPHRKWWNHELIAYPVLALLAGVGSQPWLSAFFHLKHRIAVAAVAGCLLTASVWTLTLTGMGRHLLPAPCVVSTDFSLALSRLASHSTPVFEVSAEPDWQIIAELAAEKNLEPIWRAALPVEAPPGSIALVNDQTFDSFRKLPLRWALIRRAAGWALCEKNS